MRESVGSWSALSSVLHRLQSRLHVQLVQAGKISRRSLPVVTQEPAALAWACYKIITDKTESEIKPRRHPDRMHGSDRNGSDIRPVKGQRHRARRTESHRSRARTQQQPRGIRAPASLQKFFLGSSFTSTIVNFMFCSPRFSTSRGLSSILRVSTLNGWPAVVGGRHLHLRHFQIMLDHPAMCPRAASAYARTASDGWPSMTHSSCAPIRQTSG